MVQPARKEREAWLDLTPYEQSRREVSFTFGDEFPIPPNGNMLESHLRVEILEPDQSTSRQHARPM
eukprot:12906949-Prorocentrum_lima.AAC.1